MDGGTVSLDLALALKKRLDSYCTSLDNLDAYYCGEQPLNYLHPDVRDRLQRRLTPVCINWPRLVVGAIEERLDIEGFRSGDNATADKRLWGWWQANDLDEWSQLGHTDALVHGQAFVVVWGGPDKSVPRITVESARQMVVSYYPGTHEVSAALKTWTEGEGYDKETYAVLFGADEIEKFVKVEGGEWEALEPVPNPLGVVPVVPLINRPRLSSPLGESELADVLPIADAINKLATDMMVSSEFHAMPRRWVTGMEIPREGAASSRFNAEVIQKLTETFPGKPWIAGSGVEVGQFPEATLENFIGAIRLLQSQLAALTGLPPHYLGLNTSDNPASADAIRSSEASLIKKAERKQRAFGGSWERVMRLAVAVVDGVAPASLDRMETIWRDPATPTPAQKADAAVKLTQGDRPVITLHQAREDLGYTPTQITRMEAEEQHAQDLAATADVRARIALARELQQHDGLSQSAAFAAAGMLVAAQQISTDQTPSAGTPALGAPPNQP